MTTITSRINCGNVIKLTNTTAKAIIIDFGDSTLKLTENSYPSWQVVSAEGISNITIKNGAIIGDRQNHIYIEGDGYSNGGLSDYYETHGHAHGVRFTDCGNIFMKNMDIHDMPGDGVYISSYNNTSITNISECNIHHCRRQGITIAGSDTTNIYNTEIRHIGTFDGINGTEPMSGIDIEPWVVYSEIAKTVNLDNVAITDITNYGVVLRNK